MPLEPIPPGPGLLSSLDNSNIEIKGTSNTGILSNNSNLNITSNNCSLQLSSNCNSDFSLTHSELKSSDCSNMKISGSQNKAELVSNSNTKFSGDGNTWFGKCNSNLDVSGSGSDLRLTDNSNGKISGSGNSVEAEGNSNFKILGDGNRLKLRSTFNHDLRPAPTTASNEGLTMSSNKLEISAGVSNHWWIPPVISKYVRNNGRASVHFSVDYLQQAEIAKEKYKLGIFDFTLKEESGGASSGLNYEMALDTSVLDPKSVVAKRISPSEVVLSATDNRATTKQCLTLKGPLIKEVSPNLFRFEMSGKSSM